MKEAALALDQLRKKHPKWGLAEIQEDTTHAEGFRTHHFHYTPEMGNDLRAYAVNEYMAEFVKFMEDSDFVPRRLWTDDQSEDGDASFSMVLTSMGATPGAMPQWALLLEGYIPHGGSGSYVDVQPVDIEGSIVEGEEAVQALLKKLDNSRWEDRARKVLQAITHATQNQPDKLARLYEAMEDLAPDGPVEIWRSQLQSGALDDHTPQAGQHPPRPRF